MKTYTFEVPDEFTALMADAFAASYGYAETVTNEQGEQVPNPLDKLAFARECVVKYIKEIVSAHGYKQVDAAVQGQKDAIKAQIEAAQIELKSE